MLPVDERGLQIHFHDADESKVCVKAYEFYKAAREISMAWGAGTSTELCSRDELDRLLHWSLDWISLQRSLPSQRKVGTIDNSFPSYLCGKLWKIQHLYIRCFCGLPLLHGSFWGTGQWGPCILAGQGAFFSVWITVSWRLACPCFVLWKRRGSPAPKSMRSWGSSRRLGRGMFQGASTEFEQSQMPFCSWQAESYIREAVEMYEASLRGKLSEKRAVGVTLGPTDYLWRDVVRNLFQRFTGVGNVSVTWLSLSWGLWQPVLTMSWVKFCGLRDDETMLRRSGERSRERSFLIASTMTDCVHSLGTGVDTENSCQYSDSWLSLGSLTLL